MQFETEEEQQLFRDMQSRALYLLSLREHGQKELGDKLKQKFPESQKAPDMVFFVLESCEKNNWQSDERYVESFVNQAMEKGDGPYKIRQKLQLKCDQESLIDDYLSIDEEIWIEQAKAVLMKKYGNTEKPDARNEQAKRMRFLQSRGFSQNHIWKAFD